MFKMLYHKIELKTDSRSLTKFLNAIVRVLKNSTTIEFIDFYTDRTVNFIDDLCDYYINKNETVKEWRHFIKNEECLDLDQFEERLKTTKLYRDIEEMVLFSKMRKRNILDQIFLYDDLIVNGDKEYENVESQLHCVLDTFEDLLFVKELFEELHSKVENFYDIQNLHQKLTLPNSHLKNWNVWFEVSGNLRPCVEDYRYDLLSYIDCIYQIKCANKIGAFFLKNYYSPHTKIGKRRFNKELDKLESL